MLSRENLGVVDDVLALAEQHGFWAYFQPAYEDCFRHERGLDPALGPRLYADIASRLDRARRDGRPVGVPRLPRAPRERPAVRRPRALPRRPLFGTVMPDGVVVPCHHSTDHPYPNGRVIGPIAFLSLPRPLPGPGCAISPYQEMDLIFARDPRAIAAAVRRPAGPRSGPA